MYLKKKFFETVLLIKNSRNRDGRGYFQRIYDNKFFEYENIKEKFVNINSSLSKKKGTIRGLHIQKQPFTESKLFTAVNGKTFHVFVDFRKNSSNFLKWKSAIISEKNYEQLFIPEGFIHGCQTLEDNTLILYQTSKKYSQKHEIAIRFDDPTLSIKWPIKNVILSKKDSKINYIKDLKGI